MLNIIIGILVLSSIWGFFEATLGGFLNMNMSPNKGAIMAGIGVVIMSSSLAIYKKPAMLPFIGFVAASFKLLNVWLLFVPINPIHTINPAMAIILEACVFGVLAAVLIDRLSKSATVAIGIGVVAGLVSAVGYIYFALYVTHSPVFERMGVSSIGGFVMNMGVVQMGFFGIFAPLGYKLGERTKAMAFSFINHWAWYYATSAGSHHLLLLGSKHPRHYP